MVLPNVKWNKGELMFMELDSVKHSVNQAERIPSINIVLRDQKIIKKIRFIKRGLAAELRREASFGGGSRLKPTSNLRPGRNKKKVNRDAWECSFLMLKHMNDDPHLNLWI